MILIDSGKNVPFICLPYRRENQNMKKLVNALFVLIILFCMTSLSIADSATKADSVGKADSVTKTGDEIKEGKWNVTAVTTSQGLGPNAEAQNLTTSSCITKQNSLPGDVRLPPGCDPMHLDRQGTTFTFQSLCSRGPIQISMVGTFKYEGNNMTGHIETRTNINSTSFVLETALSGSYVGPCDQVQGK